MADELKPNLEKKAEEPSLPEQMQKESGAEKSPSVEQTLERKEGQVEKDDAYNKILSKVSATHPPTNQDEVSEDAEIANREQYAESKIANLVKLVEVKGIVHAVKVARHMEDNYILDEFHDRLLADELHDALVKKGIIKEI
jgi:hypothetical protein